VANNIQWPCPFNQDLFVDIQAPFAIKQFRKNELLSQFKGKLEQTSVLFRRDTLRENRGGKSLKMYRVEDTYMVDLCQ